MIDKITLKKLITSELKDLGFKTKAFTWYVDSNSSCSVLNLQKSNYSNEYYCNLAFYIKGYEELAVMPPAEWKCQIRCRAEVALPQFASNVLDILNLDSKLEISVQIIEIQNLVKQAASILLKGKDVRELVKMYDNGVFRGGMVDLNAIKYIRELISKS
jgi:hypothetical protein